MSTSKFLYKQLCEKNKEIPIFYRYDWYNGLYGDDWDVIIEEQGGIVVAFMPFVIQRNKGFRMIVPEPLIPYQGIWIFYPKDLTNFAKLRFEKKIIQNIISKLPKVDYFEQQFHPQFSNWLPFYWVNYKQTNRYTYVLKDISNLDRVYNSFNRTTRNAINRAKKKLHVVVSRNVELFYQFKLDDYRKKGMTYDVSLYTLKKVIGFSFDTNSGEIIVALDEDGIVYSMLFYIWDEQCAYYVAGVSNCEIKDSSAMSLLLWEAIQRSSSKTKVFDFEGSMVHSIEKFFRGFGCEQTTYFQISKKHSKLLKFLFYLKGK